MDDSTIICDEVINADSKQSLTDDYETSTIPTNFNEKKATCKTQNFYILLAVLLIIIALLIAVSIYCYLIKYLTRQKYLLPFHVKINKLKEVMY